MLISFLLIFSQSIFANNCDPKVLVDKACEYFKNQPSQLIETSAKSKYINPAHFEKFIESKQSISDPSSSDVIRINKIFDELKAELIRKISNGIPFESLSPAKKNMINRIKIVELAGPTDVQAEQKIKCANQKAGAYFNPNNSKIEICPLFYQYPTEALYFSIAHELSHSIDPCAMDNNIYKVSLTQVELAYPMDEENESNKPSGLISLFVDDSDEIHMLDVGPNKIKIEEIFKDQVTKAPKVSSIPPNKYPFLDRYSCEKKKVKNEPTKSDCSDDPQNEIMSDHYGAWILNSMLNEKLSDNQKYSIIGGIFPDVCLTKIDRKTHGPQYLQSRKRMTEIILQTPGMLEKFGCEKPKENKCFKDYIDLKNSTVAPAKTSQDINQR